MEKALGLFHNVNYFPPPATGLLLDLYCENLLGLVYIKNGASVKLHSPTISHSHARPHL